VLRQTVHSEMKPNNAGDSGLSTRASDDNRNQPVRAQGAKCDDYSTSDCDEWRRDRGNGSLSPSYNTMTISLLTVKSVRSCTIKDVARFAGVSISTVSRVVNGACEVADQTRAKVFTAISRLKYSPNAHAVELGRANSGHSKRRARGSPK